MKLLSVNIAQPREIEINGRPVFTGIYEQPVSRRVRLGKLDLDGDGQADLTVHGGEHQAAYASYRTLRPLAERPRSRHAAAWDIAKKTLARSITTDITIPSRKALYSPAVQDAHPEQERFCCTDEDFDWTLIPGCICLAVHRCTLSMTLIFASAGCAEPLPRCETAASMSV